MSDDDAFRFAVPDDRDRLAELGQLAGGLVHELKNPVGVILLNAELLLTQGVQTLPSGERERQEKRLNRIIDSARSVQAIVQSFLSFARPGRPDADAVDVNRLLTALLDEQADALTAARVQVSFHPDDNLALLAADVHHLRSIFLNIIANAREALLERDGERRLLVVTRSGKNTIRVVIANNGPPFPERIGAHLFQPFTSSKEDGTGLGLAIVRRLVELHHGTVTASSDPTQGVSFAFEFPTSLGPAKPRTELPMPTVEAQIRDETDDDRATCDVQHATLSITDTPPTAITQDKARGPTRKPRATKTSHDS